jgi:hypothetical protein
MSDEMNWRDEEAVLKRMGKTLFNTEALQVRQSARGKAKLLATGVADGLSDVALIELIQELILELKRRLVTATTRVAISDLPDIPHSIRTDVGAFVRIPATPAAERDVEPRHAWRIVLASDKPDQKLISLEIVDDVVIGRKFEEFKPDLDLTEYGAEQSGMSRQHAILRPTENHLWLSDLGSTNGTFLNGGQIFLGKAQALKSDDIISLGALHFRVNIVGQPR